MWRHGAGEERYVGFDSAADFLNPALWREEEDSDSLDADTDFLCTVAGCRPDNLLLSLVDPMIAIASRYCPSVPSCGTRPLSTVPIAAPKQREVASIRPSCSLQSQQVGRTGEGVLRWHTLTSDQVPRPRSSGRRVARSRGVCRLGSSQRKSSTLQYSKHHTVRFAVSAGNAGVYSLRAGPHLANPAELGSDGIWMAHRLPLLRKQETRLRARISKPRHRAGTNRWPSDNSRSTHSVRSPDALLRRKVAP